MVFRNASEVNLIDLFKPYMTKKEVREVSKVLLSGWTGLGPKTKEFEDKFATFSDTKYAIAVNSCTAALDLSLKLINIKKHDEVIVPTMTFVSTAHVVHHNNARVIFCDIDPNTMLADIENIKRKINKKTKAIIVVHYGGQLFKVFDLRRHLSEIERQDIKIIEDCAHACGSSMYFPTGDIYPAGSIGDIGCFSFHSVKNLSIGDGGMITTNRKDWAERAKKLRWLGIDKGTWDRSKIDRSYWWEYSCDEIGLKCHMNDISAAIGLVQLNRLKEMNKRRTSIARKYIKIFEKLLEENKIYGFSKSNNYDLCSWHLFWIRIKNRDELIIKLKENNINTGVHYKPINMYKCYGDRQTCQKAENIWTELISLPIHPQLNNKQIDKIINTIKDFINNGYKK